MAKSPVIPISFKNASREVIPAFAVVQFAGDSVQNTDNRGRSVVAVKPDGTGPYAIEIGTGVGDVVAGVGTGTSDSAFGLCVIPKSHTWWVKYNGETPPAEAWVTEVGPVSGQWYMDTTGSGYLYAGAWDSTLGIILVMQKDQGTGKPIVMFEITDPDCDAGTAMATVLMVTDGTTSPAVGDEIQVCDLAGCFFNSTNTLLNGRVGFAQQMTGMTCVRQGSTGTGTATGTGTGTGTSPITNPWTVFSLCYADVEC